MIVQDLGIATAYGYAKSKGYTGTEEEFALLMASYATVAEEAVESASQAEESATDAATSASSASQSATTASTAATSASTSAQTATTKAGEASTSASNAATSASSASSSATSASTSAQTATSAAESASASATAAEEAAESINEPDTTLTIPGRAADAKAVGDNLSTIYALMEEPSSYADIQRIVRNGLASKFFSIGDVIEVGRETNLTASLGAHTGITGASVNAETFVEAMDEAGTKEYEFIYDGSVWKLNNNPVLLTTYGLSVTGTPAEGDTIIAVETASTINMVVMDFIENGQTTIGNIKLHDKTKEYGMILQSEKTLYGLQFDAREAFFYNSGENALSAGTYNITIGAHSWVSGDVGKTLKFTLANDLPVGGQLVFNGTYNATLVGTTISAYASGSALAATETVTLSEGDDGTSLGTIAIEVTGALNSIQRALIGSNRWSTSAMRQHLNSDAKAGSVWAPQTGWDRAPSWVSSTAGFKHGLDPEFIKICGDVELLTCLSTAAGDTTTTEANAGTGFETTVDKFFLPSRPEVFGGGDNNSDKGNAWQYYSANSDVPGGSSNSGNDKNRIKTNAAGSAQHWWLRSPYVGHGHYVRGIGPSGVVGYNYAYYSFGVAPACIVA